MHADMGNLVSSRKKKRERNHVTDQDRAVLDLKNSRDRLKRYQKKVTAEAWTGGRAGFASVRRAQRV